MYDASGEARKTNAPASSAGCAGRPNGTSAPNFVISSAGVVAATRGVQTGPGATTLTRMPRGASCVDSAFENVTSAPFVVAYASSDADGWVAWIELTLMIDAPGCIAGTASRHRKNGAVMFVRSVFSHSSVGISSIW